MFIIMLISMLTLLVLLTVLLIPFIQEKLYYVSESYFDKDTFIFVDVVHTLVTIITFVMMVRAIFIYG